MIEVKEAIQEQGRGMPGEPVPLDLFSRVVVAGQEWEVNAIGDVELFGGRGGCYGGLLTVRLWMDASKEPRFKIPRRRWWRRVLCLWRGGHDWRGGFGFPCVRCGVWPAVLNDEVADVGQ